MPVWLKEQSHPCISAAYFVAIPNSSHLGISSINYYSVCSAVLAKNGTEEETHRCCVDTGAGAAECAVCTDKFRPADRGYRSIRSRDCAIPTLNPRRSSRSRSQGPRYLAAYSVRALDRLSNKAIAKIRQQRGGVCPFIRLPLFYATPSRPIAKVATGCSRALLCQKTKPADRAKVVVDSAELIASGNIYVLSSKRALSHRLSPPCFFSHDSPWIRYSSSSFFSIVEILAVRCDRESALRDDRLR